LGSVESEDALGLRFIGAFLDERDSVVAGADDPVVLRQRFEVVIAQSPTLYRYKFSGPGLVAIEARQSSQS